jgi:hypothetical protein
MLDAVICWVAFSGELPGKLPIRGEMASDHETEQRLRPSKIREPTRPPDGYRLKGRIAAVTRGTGGVGNGD